MKAITRQVCLHTNHRQAKRAGQRRRREEAKQPHAGPTSCADLDGAQRLEGRWISTQDRGV